MPCACEKNPRVNRQVGACFGTWLSIQHPAGIALQRFLAGFSWGGERRRCSVRLEEGRGKSLQSSPEKFCNGKREGAMYKVPPALGLACLVSGVDVEDVMIVK
jgi:hypothetical protein